MNSTELTIGTRVIYWACINPLGEKLDPLITYVESNPRDIGGGEQMIMLAGVAGEVFVSEIEVALEEITQCHCGELIALAESVTIKGVILCCGYDECPYEPED